MASNSVLLYKIKLTQEYSMTDIVSRIENDISNETKIVVDNYNDTSLSGIYIYTEVYKSREYDFESNSFEVITRKRYVITEFHVDFKRNFMDIWGNTKNAQRIITAISIALNNRISIDAFEMKFSQMVEYLSIKEGIYVGKVSARQVVLTDGLLADCTFDLSHTDMPFETISKYKKNIQKISFKWKCTDSDISMVIHMSGAFTVYKERHMISDADLEEIYKIMLFAGRE